MAGHSLAAPSLRGRPASLRAVPEGGWWRIPKSLIKRAFLAIGRAISGAESISLPVLRDRRSKPAGLVDEVAQWLAGEKTAAIVEDDRVAPVVEIGAVARGMRRQQHARQGPQLVVGGQRLLLEDVETATGDLTRLDCCSEISRPGRGAP